MDGLRFSQIRRIRFIAANYSRLQGLRILPIGLLLFAVTFWTTLQRGPAPRPILIPLILSVSAVGLYVLIDRYYKKAFGQVIQAPRGHLDWIASIGGAAAGLGGCLVDTNFHLPFSTTGLVIAIAFLVDYLMLVHIIEVWYMPFWPVFSLFIAIFSLLPLFGLPEWWGMIGVQTQLLGVLMVSGLVMLIASVASHLYFTQAISREVPNGGSI
jgi:hypothetical protein